MAVDCWSSDEEASPEKKYRSEKRRSETSELRRRWELASVLHFLTVYAEVIGTDLKISAEEIELGLINPNTSLVNLHITLLKGIPPLSRGLDGSDAWVTVLCKKLAPWWPWVAEGEIPLIAAKGEEISGYQRLDPTKRLLLLKVLCEIRADQHDAVDYVNDALKQGTETTFFRRDQIAGDQNGTAFWYEGNAIIGRRLYKGVTVFDKECSNLPSFHWETLATNLKEFRKVADEFSLSKDEAELFVGRTVQTEAILPLETLQKKKEQAERKKQRQEMYLNNCRPSIVERATRSCRERNPVNYKSDDYDRLMKEAIQILNKKTVEDNESRGTISVAANGATDAKRDSEHGSRKRACLSDDKSGKTDEGMDIDVINVLGSDEEDYAYSGKGNARDSDSSDSGDSEPDMKSKRQLSCEGPRHFGVCWSSRLTREAGQSFGDNGNLGGAKNRLRQRPVLNSALADSIVVPDLEDDS